MARQQADGEHRLLQPIGAVRGCRLGNAGVEALRAPFLAFSGKVGAAVLLAFVSTLLTGIWLGGTLSARGDEVHSPRAILIRETAKLHLVESPGEATVERGRGTGTFDAPAMVKFIIRGTEMRGAFTVYPRGSSITGSAVAQIRGTGAVYASFAGSLSAAHGTGKYSRASGNARVYGTIKRGNDELVVQVIGKLKV